MEKLFNKTEKDLSFYNLLLKTQEKSLKQVKAAELNRGTLPNNANIFLNMKKFSIFNNDNRLNPHRLLRSSQTEK